MNDDARIVSIAGGKRGFTTAPGKPVQEVIDVLKHALAMAESGEIVAIGLARVMDRGGNVSMNGDFAYRGQASSDLYVAVDVLRQRLFDRLGEVR